MLYKEAYWFLSCIIHNLSFSSFIVTLLRSDSSVFTIKIDWLIDISKVYESDKIKSKKTVKDKKIWKISPVMLNLTTLEMWQSQSDLTESFKICKRFEYINSDW